MLEPVARAYDALAERYDREMEASAWIRTVLWSIYARVLPANAVVVDAGCGTGTDTIHLAELGHAVTAIDASSAMLAQLRDTLSHRTGLRAVTPLQGSFVDLDAIPTGSVDAVISGFCGLNTSPHLEPFGRAAHRVLRPGGKLALHLLHPCFGLPRAKALLVGLGGRPKERTFDVTIGGVSLAHRAVMPGRAIEELRPEFRAEECHYLGGLTRPFARGARPVPPAVNLAQRFLLPRFYVLVLSRCESTTARAGTASESGKAGAR